MRTKYLWIETGLIQQSSAPNQRDVRWLIQYRQTLSWFLSKSSLDRRQIVRRIRATNANKRLSCERGENTLINFF